jgi:hypothetical protein
MGTSSDTLDQRTDGIPMEETHQQVATTPHFDQNDDREDTSILQEHSHQEPLQQKAQDPPQERRTRSQRVIRPPAKFADYVDHDHIAFEALHSHNDANMADEGPIIVLKATSDPDTLYLWEAMKEPDFDKFQEAMQEEINGHTERGNWKLRKRSSIPSGATVLPAVWAMKRKQKYINGRHG